MQPYRHTIAVDRMQMVRTHARACSQSREYVIVAVPFKVENGDVIEDLRELTEDQRRFVVEDVTPAEYAVEHGLQKAQEIDRSR